MLNYRNKTRLKKHLISTLKGMVILIVSVWVLALANATVDIRKDRIVGGRSSSMVLAATLYDNPIGPSNDNQKTIATGMFDEPAEGILTSEFGARWGRMHTGIDIGGESGSDILAADGGVVTYSAWVNGYGNYIAIDHENGYQTAYAHLDELLVSEGERVFKGQKIAYMGSTGNSTGPHLHFEIKYCGEYNNPLDYVVYW